MCCCGSVRILQTGGAAPFTFSVTAGNSPYNGGLGVITGPIAINSGDIVHFYSANTIDFDVVPGSVNVHSEVRLDPNPLNTLSASAAGLMATAAPFTFDIGHNFGANYTITNGSTWKISSGNNTIDTVNMGGLISGFNVRLDTVTPGNALVINGPLGLYVPSGGVNIYNSDGTITDPTRTVTVGASTLNFNADNGGFAANVAIATNQLNIRYADNTSYEGLLNINNAYSEMSNGAPGLDEVARVYTTDSAGNDPSAGMNVYSGLYGITGINVNSGGNLGNFINLFNTGGPYFELRLNNNAGNPGEVITSQGPGVSPIWAPVTVTANSLDNLFFTTDIDWDFGGNDWNVTNVDNINFTSNTFTVNSPVVCFPNIGQNDALTRFLVQDPGGCISWRDVSTIGAGGGPIPISALLAATGTNAIDNANFNQTWEWNSLTTGVGLQLESSSITTGSLLQLDTNVSGARVGRLVNVLSTNSTKGFRGIQVTTNDTSTEGVNITQTGMGRALRVETANAGPGGSGAPLIEFERTNAASDGETIQRNLSLGNDTGLLVSTAATSAIVASFSGNSLTSGQILRATSTSAFSGAVMQAIATGQHTGQVFDVQSSLSTQAFANGGARFFFGGNHTGSSVLIDSGTTAGNALEIISAVNSGTALKIDATSLNTGEAIDIDAGTTDGNVYIRFSESGVTQGNITNGAGNTVLYNTTSDRNLKENIQETDMLATDLIESIEVVEYNFKSDKDKNTLHGLIAQDLYEVYPEAVTKGIGKSPWSIDYSKLVPVLLKSIQELSARIDELENNL